MIEQNETQSIPCPCNSGKIFTDCHGAPKLEVVASNPDLVQPKTELAPPPGRKLDLGCGRNSREGFEGVDIASSVGAKHVVDLWKFPWPFESNSVGELHCSHHVEHIPAREVEDRDILSSQTAGARSLNRDRFVGQDMLFAFFDECYRILQPGGWMKVIVPACQSTRAFQDPTHRRFLTAATFAYLSAKDRKAMGVDHYRVSCDFSAEGVPTIPEEIAAYNPEAQMREMQHKWNVVQDWHVQLKSLKPAT